MEEKKILQEKKNEQKIGRDDILELLSRDEIKEGVKQLSPEDLKKYSLTPLDTLYCLVAHRNIKNKTILDYLTAHKDADIRVLTTVDLIIDSASQEEKATLENELTVLLKQEKPAEDIAKYVVNYLHSKYNPEEINAFTQKIQKLINKANINNETVGSSFNEEKSIDVMILPSKTKPYTIYINDSVFNKKFNSVDDIVLNVKSFCPKNEAIFEDILKELKEKINKKAEEYSSKIEKWSNNPNYTLIPSLSLTMAGGTAVIVLFASAFGGENITPFIPVVAGFSIPVAYYFLKIKSFLKKSEKDKKKVYFLEAHKNDILAKINNNSKWI